MGLIDDTNPLTRRKIAVKMGVTLNELSEIARRLCEVGLIDQETLQPLAWNKRQFVSDTDPTNTERQRKYRMKAKPAVSNALRNGSITPVEEETDKETEQKQKTELPEWLPLAVIADFREHRKKIKKPLTERAEQLFMRELERLRDAGHDPVECVETAILNGWSSVYAPKTQAVPVVKSYRDEWTTK
jgi:hypothetical protein